MTASSLAFAIACSMSGHRPEDPNRIELRVGEYLREDYIKALCSTLSPLKATRPDGFPQLIVVARGQIGLSFMPIHNFHEGDEPYHVTKTGTVKQDGLSSSEIGTLIAQGPEAFSLEKEHSTFRFWFVGNAERWVSNAVIAGSYRDASGRMYVLDRSGKAFFPGQKVFSYSLSLDHVLTNHDYIYSSDLEKSWAAVITPQSLFLHDESGDVGEIVSPTPHWILSRVSSSPACKQP